MLQFHKKFLRYLLQMPTINRLLFYREMMRIGTCTLQQITPWRPYVKNNRGFVSM